MNALHYKRQLTHAYVATSNAYRGDAHHATALDPTCRFIRRWFEYCGFAKLLQGISIALHYRYMYAGNLLDWDAGRHFSQRAAVQKKSMDRSLSHLAHLSPNILWKPSMTSMTIITFSTIYHVWCYPMFFSSYLLKCWKAKSQLHGLPLCFGHVSMTKYVKVTY